MVPSDVTGAPVGGRWRKARASWGFRALDVWRAQMATVDRRAKHRVSILRISTLAVCALITWSKRHCEAFIVWITFQRCFVARIPESDALILSSSCSSLSTEYRFLQWRHTILASRIKQKDFDISSEVVEGKGKIGCNSSERLHSLPRSKSCARTCLNQQHSLVF